MEDLVERLRGWAAYMPQTPESRGMEEAAATIAARDAEIERLRAVLQDAMARPDEISSDLMDVFAAALATRAEQK